MRNAIGMAVLAALAACSQSGAGNGAGANEAAGAAPASGGASGALTLQPGQWESTLRIEAANMPNLPPGVNMPERPPVTTRICITPEMAANPSAESLGGNAGMQREAGCQAENFTFANGRIQGSISCNRRGIVSRTTISGEYTPTSYEQTVRTETEAGGTSQTSTIHISARRIGDCPSG